MKTFAFLSLLLALFVTASCLDDPPPDTCGPAPLAPGYTVVTNGDGTVTMSLADYYGIETWRSDVESWGACKDAP